ncbi:hypothetical protein SASPL_108731 [Salvia splendens]|uniref:Uncharacterized protein n=1 Tax=Salvia splendens TaxID=180675 RepID=A0A8X8YFU4_SALSN|nr:hypothetical protein SASPL_108731 [Salvia splendens]
MLVVMFFLNLFLLLYAKFCHHLAFVSITTAAATNTILPLPICLRPRQIPHRREAAVDPPDSALAEARDADAGEHATAAQIEQQDLGAEEPVEQRDLLDIILLNSGEEERKLGLESVSRNPDEKRSMLEIVVHPRFQERKFVV